MRNQNTRRKRHPRIASIAKERFNVARRKLAFIRNRQGRRHDAVTLIRELCISGDAMQDELHAMIVESDPIHDQPRELESPASIQPREASLHFPTGASGQARLLFGQER